MTMVLLPARLVVTLRLNGWNTMWLTQINLSPHISGSIVAYTVQLTKSQPAKICGKICGIMRNYVDRIVSPPPAHSVWQKRHKMFMVEALKNLQTKCQKLDHGHTHATT